MLKRKYTHENHRESAEFFHTTPKQLQCWLKDGAPENEDGTINLFMMHQWLLKRVQKTGAQLKDAKLEEEVKKLQIQNQKLLDKYIDRDEMEKILSSRASGLRNYFERSLAMNRASRSMRSVEELVTIDYEFSKQLMESYLGKKENKKS